MKRAALVLSVIMLAAASQCGAEGIQTLIAVGKSMSEAKKVTAAEDAAFAKVKRALESGALANGQPQSAIRSQYGEPVVMNEDPSMKRQRWVYKSAKSSFFKGERIYLYFDSNGILDEIKILQ